MGNPGLVRDGVTNAVRDVNEDTSCEKMDNMMSRLWCLYALGDMLQDPAFCNAIIDEFLLLGEQSHEYLDAEQIGEVYEVIPLNSTMVRLMVDIWSACCDEENWEMSKDVLPKHFVLSMMEGMIRERFKHPCSRFPTNRARCYYHEHAEGEEKCKLLL
jgi:hypothetical protein